MCVQRVSKDINTALHRTHQKEWGFQKLPKGETMFWTTDIVPWSAEDTETSYLFNLRLPQSLRGRINFSEMNGLPFLTHLCHTRSQ